MPFRECPSKLRLGGNRGTRYLFMTLRDTYNGIYPRADQVSIFPGVVERLIALRDAGYLLVGVTNQGGVSKK